jgi:hypothetical protein
VLPVRVRTTSRDQIPSYLKAVTILEPHGNVGAETSAKVDQMGGGKAEPEKASAESEQSQVGSPRSNREVLAWIGGGLAIVAAGLWVVFVYLKPANVEANCGSVAVGGNVAGATINAGTSNSDCSTKVKQGATP